MSSFDLKLRAPQPSDAHAIAHLHAESWRHAYRGALSDEYLAGDIAGDREALWTQRLQSPRNNQHIVVAENNDLMGFACLYSNDDPIWGSLLDNIHVRPGLHGHGIGTQLLFRISDMAKAAAVNAGLYLWVLQNNQKAQAFYRRHGAHCAGEDVWAAPGGTQIPRFRFAWPAGSLPKSLAAHRTFT